MNGQRFVGALVLAAVVRTSGIAPAQDGPAIIEPAQIGQIFCIARLGNDMAPVEGLLSAHLAAAIDEADAANAAWQAANRDEKPPLGDGIPWQSRPDYAPKCVVGEVSYEMDESRVRIDYGFPGEPDAGFTDTLYLKLLSGEHGWNVWRLDNIGYAEEGDLRKALAGAFMD